MITLLFGNGPKSVVKNYLKKSESLSEKEGDLNSKYMLFANKKALKKLDMYDDDDDEDDVDYSWKVTKTKKFGKSDDVTEGVRAYVKARKGDEDKVQNTALVEVTITVKQDGDKEKIKEYFMVVKVGGNWYLLDDDGDIAENINDGAEKWENMAGSSKKSKKSDDDDD